VAFTKRDIYTVVVSMLILLTNCGERQAKILNDLFANIPDARNFFEGHFAMAESNSPKAILKRLQSQFKADAIDHFDQFTCVFFEVV
jgi:hypothetical protein